MLLIFMLHHGEGNGAAAGTEASACCSDGTRHEDRTVETVPSAHIYRYVVSYIYIYIHMHLYIYIYRHVYTYL